MLDLTFPATTNGFKSHYHYLPETKDKQWKLFFNYIKDYF